MAIVPTSTALTAPALTNTGSAIDALMREGYKIKKISLELFGEPFVVREGENPIRYHQLRLRTTFIPGPGHELNGRRGAEDMAHSLRNFNEMLREYGSFAELTCTATIEGVRARADGGCTLADLTVRKHLEGLIDSPAWEKSLFGYVTPAALTDSAGDDVMSTRSDTDALPDSPEAKAIVPRRHSL